MYFKASGRVNPATARAEVAACTLAQDSILGQYYAGSTRFVKSSGASPVAALWA